MLYEFFHSIVPHIFALPHALIPPDLAVFLKTFEMIRPSVPVGSVVVVVVWADNTADPVKSLIVQFWVG